MSEKPMMWSGEQTFTCAACQRVLRPAWTPAEAMAATQELWGEVPPLDDALPVCETCISKLEQRLGGALGLRLLYKAWKEGTQ